MKKTKFPPATVQQVEDFLTELQLRTHTNMQFNVTRLGREYNLTDGRLLDFLQDVNIIKNIGGTGRHAIWVWNSRMNSGREMAILFLERFNIYKYNQTIAAKKNPKVLHQFSALDEQVKAPSIELTPSIEKILKDINFGITKSIVWQGKSFDNTSALRNQITDLVIALRTGKITVVTPIFFGLIKLKSTIKIKTH